MACITVVVGELKPQAVRLLEQSNSADLSYTLGVAKKLPLRSLASACAPQIPLHFTYTHIIIITVERTIKGRKVRSAALTLTNFPLKKNQHAKLTIPYDRLLS